ncbi:MAG TPA: transcriptional repressor LexA [Planctomycetota bacterium]|nr:transcriptional repressor LexA [Planctomycetota bacterium]
MAGPIMLTERQATVLRFFRDYHRQHGFAPTLDEAAQALGVNRITVHEHLRQLEAKGAIVREPGRSRAVAVVFDPDARGETAAAESTLPLLGRIRAGRPIEAVEDREEIRLDELIPTGANYYLLQVRGNSMIEDHIADGDLVVVEGKRPPRNGDVVVAILPDEEATLKRYYREPDGRVRLQPANAEMEPIYVDEVEIRGVVRGVVRRFR